jgi:hypothetical protein
MHNKNGESHVKQELISDALTEQNIEDYPVLHLICTEFNLQQKNNNSFQRIIEKQNWNDQKNVVIKKGGALPLTLQKKCKMLS